MKQNHNVEHGACHIAIRFMKDVVGENGGEAEICQSTMEIDTSNKTPPRWQ